MQINVWGNKRISGSHSWRMQFTYYALIDYHGVFGGCEAEKEECVVGVHVWSKQHHSSLVNMYEYRPSVMRMSLELSLGLKIS